MTAEIEGNNEHGRENNNPSCLIKIILPYEQTDIYKILKIDCNVLYSIMEC